MRSGIELITIERKEQIEKHGYTKEWDLEYTDGELLMAARYCEDPEEGKWPPNWSSQAKLKIDRKHRIEQLICAGAFYLAENDRIGEDKYLDKINEIAHKIESHQKGGVCGV